MKVQAEPAAVSNGFFNHLSMIYKMEMLPNNLDDPNYEFILGTNSGIAFLKINKQDLTLTLSKEKHLDAKVVNHLLIRGNKIIAFIHDEDKFHLIDRKSKEVTNITWLQGKSICCTGLQWAPDYDTNEMSIIYVRGTGGIHMVNT